MRHASCVRPIVFVLAASALAAQPSYAVQDLDGNGMLGLGAAFRIAENGTAVGLGNPLAASNTRAVTWTNQVSTVLPALPGHEYAEGHDINEVGVVVGQSFDQIQTFPFYIAIAYGARWDGGVPTELNTLKTGGATYLDLQDARRIDERDRIAGQGRDASIPTLRSYILEPSGLVTDLGALSATGSTDVHDMNDLGLVVGCSEAARGVDHAYLWRNGVMTDLHDPTVIFGRTSTARAINEGGVIVGSADFVNDNLQYETAAVWRNGTVQNLGTLAGNQSYARDVNDHGTIVGTTTFAGSGVHAFVYRGGVMQDLNTLIPAGSGWTLANAHAITNDGRIVGEGFNNGLRPFLAVPDQCGTFTVYGQGCAGSGGVAPRLWGEGCAVANGQVSVAVTGGLGGALGVLALGAGNGSATILPGCAVQILPLFPATVALRLGGAGAGAGTTQLGFTLPAGTGPASLFLQAALVDPGANGGLVLSNPLRMDTQ